MNDLISLEQIRRIRQARQQIVNVFMTRHNVVACGIGYKSQGQQPTGVPSIVISVTHKQPPDVLFPDEIIPQMVDDVPTDVIETGPIVSFAINRKASLRPVRPGISIGHWEGSTGTVGCPPMLTFKSS